jgi:Beta-lactamase enzyme family
MTRTRRGRRPYPLLVLAGVLVVVSVVALRLLPGSPLAAQAAAKWESPTAAATTTGAPRAGSPSAEALTASPSPTLPSLAVRPATVKIDASGWWSWALLDTRTGTLSGPSSNSKTSTTASLIKAWIGADFLRRAQEASEIPSDQRMAQLSRMIRDSDNAAAESLFDAVGRTDSIERLIGICKLKDSSASSAGGWSRTMLSPADIARMGACIADSRAAGPKWTKWLINEMRQVRGTGDFGIRKAFPAEVQKTIAIKNGWIDRQAEQEYHVSCLAIGDGWVIGVMARYAINKGYTYGAQICQEVGEQLRAT